jgi:hypothetical protein
MNAMPSDEKIRRVAKAELKRQRLLLRRQPGGTDLLRDQPFF